MEIYLIRHTHVAVEKSVCYGQSDVALADTFHDELAEIKNKLSLTKAYTIYSSPLQRSLKLAEHLDVSVQPVIDNRLMELNFGNWELKKWDKIKQEELNIWMNDFVNYPCPGGESYKDLYKRSSDFFNQCISRQHQQVLIIAHGGIIRSILSLILQIPLERSFSLKIDCGKISKIKVISKENIIVEYINH